MKTSISFNIRNSNSFNKIFFLGYISQPPSKYSSSGFNKATIHDLRSELDDAKDELDGYKEDNEERSETIKGLLELRKQ